MAFYDSMMDFLFEEALDRMERVCDPDEQEVKNRPCDDEDTWMENCVTEEEWKRRNAIFSEEWRKAQAEINARYKGV